MQEPIKLALALALAFCLGCDRGVNCSTTEQDWEALTRDIYTCERSSECTTFERGDYCDCFPLVQLALRRDAVSKVSQFVQQVEATCRNEQGDLPAPFWNLCDAAPLANASCQNGRCVADSVACNVGPPPPQGGAGGKGGKGGTLARVDAGADDT
jgi:hypothetical protein